MTVKDHVILSSAASLALWTELGFDAIFFWVAAIGIDLDHYIDYIWHNGFTDFGIKKMFLYHHVLERFWGRSEFLNVVIFHTVEFVAPLFVISYWTGSTALFALSLGLTFHIACDIVFLLRLRIFLIRAHSFTEYFIRKRRFENRGLKPGSVFAEAIKIVNETGREI